MLNAENIRLKNVYYLVPEIIEMTFFLQATGSCWLDWWKTKERKKEK